MKFYFPNLCFFLVFLNYADCAKILGIFNMASYSHFILGEALLKELARQGHEVTMMSPYPQKTPVKNYRDIELVESRNLMKEKQKNFPFFNFGDIPWVVKMFLVASMGYESTESSLINADVQKLIKSDEKFDLIILETFLNEAFYGFAHKFDAPVIILGTSGASSWVNHLTGNPAPSSHVPEIILPYNPKMTLLQRMNNLFVGVAHEILYHFYQLPQQNKLLQKYFPNSPYIKELVYKYTSFVLLNSHPGESAPVPLTPNMKEIGGFHINDEKKLSEDVKKFLDESKEGVIYLSLGSNLKSANLPKEKLDAILNGFKRWGKPVLWKFEDESLPGKPQNVKISKWLPQFAVLAHPNVKAFITHGGKLSIMESTYFGVPVIGIPVFGDQPHNMKQVEYAGNGITLDFKTLTEDSLYESMVEISRNTKYTEEAKIRSAAMRSGRISALEEAIHWIEYVIKFKGAAHLRNEGVNLAWYQLYSLDVALVLGFIVLVCYVVLKQICKMICKKCKSKQQKPEKAKQQKAKTKTH